MNSLDLEDKLCSHDDRANKSVNKAKKENTEAGNA